MLNSEWLDIATGVVLVWFLFALGVSAVNEGLVKVFALRSKQLWSALRQMLDGSESPQGILRSLVGLPTRSRPASPYPAANASVSTRLYATKTLQALEIRSKPTQKTRIEHIPATVFSHALIELAMQVSGPGGASGTGGASGAAVGAAGPAGGAAGAAGGAAGAAGGAAGTAGVGPIAQVESYIDDLPPGPLKGQLQAVLFSAGDDIAQFRDGVESWFDGQMTRLSRLYRAQVHIILVLIGLVVAVVGFGFGLQSNSLQLVSELQHDQNLRTVVVGAASAAARGDLAKAAGCDLATDPNPALCQLRGVSSLNKIDFALRGDTPNSKAGFGERLGFILPWRHFYAAVGVIITGIAVSFGSSFWFALLKRLVGLRGGSAPAS
jgi:hypothetical protein